MQILDCGHPLDKGTPAQVINKSGNVETIQGWQSVRTEDGREICHACANKQILDCGHPPSPHSDFTTGYGEDKEGKKYCYECCAKRDKAAMLESGRATLYLTEKDGQYSVTNWPGSLNFIPFRVRVGRHNIAGSRYDVWFTVCGEAWHGVNYGENTQICHCRKVKN